MSAASRVSFGRESGQALELLEPLRSQLQAGQAGDGSFGMLQSRLLALLARMKPLQKFADAPYGSVAQVATGE